MNKISELQEEQNSSNYLHEQNNKKHSTFPKSKNFLVVAQPSSP